jgi:AAA+ ATPase superfamily predicted ATPase
MSEGKIREEHKKTLEKRLLDMPVWIAYIISNINALEDFKMFMEEGIQNCEREAADLFLKDQEKKVAILLGKREAIKELLYQIEMYEREEMQNG